MLNEIQLQFIETHFKTTKTDKLIENMAKLKSFMPKMLLEQAKALDDSDCFASMWEVSFDHSQEYSYQCICGKRLKNRYVLRHKYKEIELHLGSTHYEHYCDIHITDVNRIVEEQEAYSKVKWEFEKKMADLDIVRMAILQQMPSLPKLYQQQLAIGLPLLDQQVAYLNQNKRLSHGIHTIMTMDAEMLHEVEALDAPRRSNFIIHLQSGEDIRSIHDVKALSYSEIRDREDTGVERHNATPELLPETSENYIKNLGWFGPNPTSQQETTREPVILTDRMMKFLASVADEEERESMMRNTINGVCQITNVNHMKQLSAKMHLQGRLKISMSDRQYAAYAKGSPYITYDWKHY